MLASPFLSETEGKKREKKKEGGKEKYFHIAFAQRWLLWHVGC